MAIASSGEPVIIVNKAAAASSVPVMVAGDGGGLAGGPGRGSRSGPGCEEVRPVLAPGRRSGRRYPAAGQRKVNVGRRAHRAAGGGAGRTCP